MTEPVVIPDAKPTVATPSPAYRWMEGYRALPRLMRGGVKALREEAGKSGDQSGLWSKAPGGTDVDHLRAPRMESSSPILIRNPIEDDEDFAARVRRLQWWDPYWTAMDRLGRKPFAHEVTLTGPAPLMDWAKDIDGNGRDFRRFAADCCVESAGYGIGYIMPDWSEELGRPVFTWIDSRFVIAVDTDPETGRKRARIRTVRLDLGEWTAREIPQVTVIYGPGGTQGAKSPSKRVYELIDPGDVTKGWAPKGAEEPLRGRYWPLVPLYTGFEAADVAIPPASALAELARIHLNKQSRLDAILDTANIPIRYWSGVSEDQIKKFKELSVKQTIWNPSDARETDLKYVEVQAHGIAKAIEDLDRVERRCEVLGWAPLVTRPRGNETATSVATESAVANTQAEAYTIGWADGFAQASIVACSQAELETAGVGTAFWHDFGIQAGDLKGLELMMRAMSSPNGTLFPWLTWFRAWERHGLLGEDEKPEDLAAEMEAREDARRSAAANTDPVDEEAVDEDAE